MITLARIEIALIALLALIVVKTYASAPVELTYSSLGSRYASQVHNTHP